MMQSSRSEMNRIHLVLFDMDNRTFGAYLAAIIRILNSLVQGMEPTSLVQLQEVAVLSRIVAGGQTVNRQNVCCCNIISASGAR
jgi:hypothetical protein